jgi:hypothetical protein
MRCRWNRYGRRRPRGALSLARSSPVPPPKQPQNNLGEGQLHRGALRPASNAAAPAWPGDRARHRCGRPESAKAPRRRTSRRPNRRLQPADEYGGADSALRTDADPRVRDGGLRGLVAAISNRPEPPRRRLHNRGISRPQSPDLPPIIQQSKQGAPQTTARPASSPSPIPLARAELRRGGVRTSSSSQRRPAPRLTPAGAAPCSPAGRPPRPSAPRRGW